MNLLTRNQCGTLIISNVTQPLYHQMGFVQVLGQEHLALSVSLWELAIRQKLLVPGRKAIIAFRSKRPIEPPLTGTTFHHASTRPSGAGHMRRFCFSLQLARYSRQSGSPAYTQGTSKCTYTICRRELLFEMLLLQMHAHAHVRPLMLTGECMDGERA
jgi:hypothetical protein